MSEEGTRRGIVTRPEWIFVAFLLAFCALFVFVELNNGRLWTSDFRVYYDATRDFFAGNNPYSHNYGLDTGHFKYAPFTLYLFAPQTLVSYEIGQCIHLSLLAFSLMYSTINMKHLLERYPIFSNERIPTGMLYLLFACVAIHITRELHLGNINLVLLLLFNLGLNAALKKKEPELSVWWSLMIVLKPIMILVIIPLLINKRWKPIFYMAVFGVLFVLFPAFHVGFQGNITLWKNWFEAISEHGEYLTNFNAIGTLIRIHTGFTAGWIVSLICLLGLIALLVKDSLRLRKSQTETIIVWSAVFSAFIPNFFVTDTEHFLLSAPLIWLLLAELRSKGRWYHWIGFALGMLLFSFNSTDLLGNFSHYIYDNGFLGIGNLLFIGTFLVVRCQKKASDFTT